MRLAVSTFSHSLYENTGLYGKKNMVMQYTNIINISLFTSYIANVPWISSWIMTATTSTIITMIMIIVIMIINILMSIWILFLLLQGMIYILMISFILYLSISITLTPLTWALLILLIPASLTPNTRNFKKKKIYILLKCNEKRHKHMPECITWNEMDADRKKRK